MSSAALPAARPDAPPSAAARRYLRDTLPGIYRERVRPDEEPTIVGFVGGLERVLDPIVTLLDNLGAHFDPRTAPEPVVDGLAAALGLREAPVLPLAGRRELVAAAAEHAALRGTRVGLERVLALAAPGLDVAVEDSGGVSWGKDAASVPEAPPPGFRLRCGSPPAPETARMLDRLADLQRPAHAAYVPLAGSTP